MWGWWGWGEYVRVLYYSTSISWTLCCGMSFLILWGVCVGVCVGMCGCVWVCVWVCVCLCVYTGGHRWPQVTVHPLNPSQVSTKLSVELLEDPHEKEVNELAAMLDLRKVGGEPESCKTGKMFFFLLLKEGDRGRGGER